MDNKEQKIQELLSRGVSELIHKESLEKKLRSDKILRVKFGIDPTSPNLHLGRSVPLLKLKDFQDLGHQIVLIIGGATGVIGDTSDKNAERPMLTQEFINENIKVYKEQIGKILDLDKVEYHNNAEWLDEMNFSEIGELATMFSVNSFISRDNIRKRLKEGKRVSLREVLYPLMQGYDSVKIKSDVEVGGNDQRFNILSGRHMQEQMKMDPQDVILNPLFNGLDGRKMSSSWGNTINVLDIPSDMFGKVMSLRDEMILDYFNGMTRISLEKIAEYRSQLESGINPKDTKIELAKTLVTMYHTEKEAEEAYKDWEKTFSEGGIPEETKTAKVKIKVPMADILLKHGLISSKSEFQRLVKEGAIKFKVSKEEKKIIDPKSLVEESGALRIGKKRFLKIEIIKD